MIVELDKTRELLEEAAAWRVVEVQSDPATASRFIQELAATHKALLTEMHARELHHFEEEQKSSQLGARIGNAIVAVETDEPPHVIIGMLRGELRWNHNTAERTDDS